MKRLVNGFFEHAPNHLRNLKEALDGNDSAGVQLRAHTIKGVAANFSSSALRDTAYDIEKAGKEADIERARSLYPDLEQKFNLLAQALEKEK